MSLSGNGQHHALASVTASLVAKFLFNEPVKGTDFTAIMWIV